VLSGLAFDFFFSVSPCLCGEPNLYPSAASATSALSNFAFCFLGVSASLR